MKKCSTCLIDKPFSEFRTEKRTKLGLQARCKQCESNYKRTYIKEASSIEKRVVADRKRKLSYRDLYRSNPSLIDTIKICDSCHETKSADHFNKALSNKGGLRDSCKVCDRKISRIRYLETKEKVFGKLGRVCCRCGFSDDRALQIDHINGGGNREHKEIKNSIAFLKKVLADTEGLYQILCANCNWIKRRENNEEPVYELRLPSSLSELEPVPYESSK